MIYRYAIALAAITLVSCSCTSMAPVSTPSISENLTPVTLITPDSTSTPSPSESIPRVTVEELLQKIESNADIMIIDTRADVEKEFASGHIKGAIPVPLTEIIAAQWTPPAESEIILYCA